MTTATLHPFEIAGFGRAPFRFVRLQQKVNADGFPCGTCDYCGAGVRYEYILQSFDNKPEFRVGCDCVEKTLQGNNVLLSDVTRAKKRVEHEQREAKRMADAQSKWVVCEVVLQAERDANGGKTLADIRWEAEQAEKLAQKEADRIRYTAENGWIISALKTSDNDFVKGICRQLETGPLTNFRPGRPLNMVCEIYAKTFGRANSKKYRAAADAFWANGQIAELIKN